MAINTFFIQVDLGGSPTNPNQATSYTIRTPWGDTHPRSVWEQAFNEAFHTGTKVSGRMGMYFQQGITNGVTSTVSGSQNGNPIRNG